MSTPIDFMGRKYAKAQLVISDPPGTTKIVPLHFNPAEYSLSKGNLFAEIPIPGLESPPLQYVRGQIETLTIEKLYVDTSDSLENVRTQYVAAIQGLMRKTEKLHAPPVVKFVWGEESFTGVLEKLDVKYLLFHHDGKPLRAELKLVLKEYKPIKVQAAEKGRNQNSPDVEKRYVVRAGETLSSISGSVYRDPRLWRELAVANDIMDPRSVAPGTLLTVPALQERPL